LSSRWDLQKESSRWDSLSFLLMIVVLECSCNLEEVCLNGLNAIVGGLGDEISNVMKRMSGG
jgi:hypothetical protein